VQADNLRWLFPVTHGDVAIKPEIIFVDHRELDAEVVPGLQNATLSELMGAAVWS